MLKPLKWKVGRGRGRYSESSSSDDQPLAPCGRGRGWDLISNDSSEPPQRRGRPIGRGRGRASSSDSSSTGKPARGRGCVRTALSFLATPAVPRRRRSLVSRVRERAAGRGRASVRSSSEEGAKQLRLFRMARVRVRLLRARVPRRNRVLPGQFDDIEAADSNATTTADVQAIDVQAIFDQIPTLGSRERKLAKIRIEELYLNR